MGNDNLGIEGVNINQAQTDNQQGNGAQHQQQRGGEGLTGFDLLQNISRPSAESSRTSKTPLEIAEVIRKAAEDVGMAAGTKLPPVEVITLENQDLKIDSILIATTYKEKLYTLCVLLESSCEGLAPFIEEVQGIGQVSTYVPNSYLFDDFYRSKAVERIHAEGLEFDEVAYVDGLLLPRTAALSDELSLKKTAQKIYDIAIAAITVATRIASGWPSSLLNCKEHLASSEVDVVSELTICPDETVIGDFGEVIAADWKIATSARRRNRPKDFTYHGSNDSLKLAELVGTVDFLYSLRPDDVNTQAVSPNPSPVAAYIPVIRITDTNSYNKKEQRGLNDLTTFLLSITSVKAISQPGQLMRIFEPSTISPHNKASLGNLGLEHDPYENAPAFKSSKGVIDIVSYQEGTAESPTVPNIMTRYCHPITLVSLDIRRGGSKAWYQNILRQAVPGSKAYEIIVRELDHFTDSNFSAIWDPAKSFLLKESVEIILGSYPDNDGTMRDVRSIDYLRMLEATGGEPEPMIKFSTGANPGEGDRVTKARRWEQIVSLVPAVEANGIADQFYINPEFINAIDEAMRLANAHIQVDGALFNQSNARTAVFDPHTIAALAGGGAFINRINNPGLGNQGYGQSNTSYSFNNYY